VSDGSFEALDAALVEATGAAALLWLSGEPASTRRWDAAALARFRAAQRLFASAVSVASGRLQVSLDDPRLAAWEALTADERAARLEAMRKELGSLLTRRMTAKTLAQALPVSYAAEAAPAAASTRAEPRLAFVRELATEVVEATERRRMGDVLRRFEEAQARRRADDADDATTPAVDWALDAAERGGLTLVVGPFAAHPPLPATLVLAQGDGRYVVATAGLRAAATTVSVTPAREALHWRMEALDEAARAWLGSQPPPWIFDGDVHAFEGAEGAAGERLVARTLTLGERYRLLVPARREAAVRAALGEATWAALAEGWHVATVALSTTVAAETIAALEALGFEVREASMTVRLTAPDPIGTVSGAGRASMVRVRAGEAVTVAVTGPATQEADAARVFVGAAGSWAVHALAAGEGWTVVLGAMTPGRYVVRAAHSRSKVASSDLLLEVLAATGDGALAVEIAGEVCARERLRGRAFDLAEVLRGEGLRVRGAPTGGWVTWRGVETVFLGAVRAGEGEVVALDAVAERLRALVADDPVGDLCVDAGAAGELVVAHEGAADDEAARTRLLGLVDAARSLFADASGPLGMWRATWFAPVCRALGYGVEVPDAGERVTAEGMPDASVWRLVQARRAAAGGACERARVGALVVLPGGFAWETRAGEARALAAAACARWGCARALVSDGLRWTAYEAGRRRVLRVVDVGAACEAGGDVWREAMDLLGG
jgi:hypothetical protein